MTIQPQSPREHDVVVAQKLFKWAYIVKSAGEFYGVDPYTAKNFSSAPTPETVGAGHQLVPMYSTDIVLALQAIEALPAGLTVEINRDTKDKRWSALVKSTFDLNKPTVTKTVTVVHESLSVIITAVIAEYLNAPVAAAA
jgi:hypothetical protein